MNKDLKEVKEQAIVRSERTLLQTAGTDRPACAVREPWRMRFYTDTLSLLTPFWAPDPERMPGEMRKGKSGMKPQMGQNTKKQTENKMLMCQCRPFPEGRT